MAAMMAVGVASTSAQGQKTTRMVTARSTSPLMIQVPAAASRAVSTIQVAQRSARRTMRALPASADWTRRIMRCRALSSPTLTARMSNAPNWLTVPLLTLVAGALVHRQGFAGHDRLVDGRLAIEDDAVHGDGLAGQHAQRIARPHGLGRDDAFRTAFRQTARRARGEMHQPLDAGPCPRHGALFQQRAQLHDEGDFARSKDLADNDRRHQRQRHQHVRADVETGEEALRPFAEDGHAAKQDRQPGRVQPADAHIAKTQYQRQRGRAQRCRLPGFLSQPLPYLCEHDASMKK